MGLVDDDRVVAPEQRVAVDLGEHDPVGHELHVGRRRRPVVEADLVTDVGAEHAPELRRDAGGDARGGEAARLGDANLSLEPAPHGEGDLRELRRLPRAGRPGDDDHRVLVDGEGDVGDARRDGELGRKRERRRAWQLQPEERWRWARRSSSASRASVRAAMAARLSWALRPRARPRVTLTRPSLK